MTKKSTGILFLILVFFLFNGPVSLRAKDKDAKRPQAVKGLPSHTKLNLNNISTWIYNDLNSDVTPQANSGFMFPRGSGNTTVYESGLIWGAKVNGQVRVGGSTYISGMQPGRIISTGIAEDTNLASTRVYRVRPDYKTADFTIEASEEGLSQSEIRQQYEKDWNEWPASEGAPFTDLDGDGKYNPEKDIPGVKNAAQTVWSVSNDLEQSRTQKLYGSLPMGIEVQTTCWAYNQDAVSRNAYFKKYKLINKSNTSFTDMYISMWSDPDVGDATDDYAGCDTTLNLGYAYNSSNLDVDYRNTAPPAVGFDYLEGPLVKGTPGKDLNKNGIDDSKDTAIYNGTKLVSYINLPMTSFFYFAKGDIAVADPTLNSYEGTIQFYNFMQGHIGKTGEPFRNPQGSSTTYALSGDPVAGSGWLDGILEPAGDRRIGMASGPFTMAAGDTQEVVFAEVAAMGKSNLLSVQLLKQYDKKIKKYFNNLFNFPLIAAPQSPDLNVTYSNSVINLSWNQDTAIENFNRDNYMFEGYNLYQLPNGIADKKGAIRLATFDKPDGILTITGGVVDTLTLDTVIVAQQFGTDSGIKHELSVTSDRLSNSKFLTGKKYYYGISAYTYRADASGKMTNTESPIRVVPVVFQDTLPGMKYLDTLMVTRISGHSDKAIIPVVIDASKLTGHEYQVGFNSASVGRSTWFLKDLTTGKLVATDQPTETSASPQDPLPVFDGIRVLAVDVVPGMKDFQIPSGERKWTWANANYNLEGFNGAIGYTFNTIFSTTVTSDKLSNTLIKFAATDSLGNLLNTNDPNASFAYRYLRGATNPPAKPEFVPFIKNKTSGYAYQDYTKSLPFAAFNNETGQRLMVGYLENNSASGRVDGKYWPPAGDEGIDNTATTGPREWFFIFNLPYSETPDPALMIDILNNASPMLWFGTPNRRGAKSVAFAGNDQFLILHNNPFSTEDVFNFRTGTLTSVEKDNAPLKYDLVQNYPNPFNPVTQIRFSLPEKGAVTLRVYNILGQMVKELINGELNAGVHNVEFDGHDLASGMYIYRLDVKNKYSDVKKMLLLK